MKTIACLSLVILFACNKDSFSSRHFKVKGVMVSCKSIVVEVLHPDFFHLGETNWKNPRTGLSIDHVFTIKNYCEVIKKFPKDLKYDPWIDAEVTLELSIDETSSFSNKCSVCDPLLNEPKTEHVVKCHSIELN